MATGRSREEKAGGLGELQLPESGGREGSPPLPDPILSEALATHSVVPQLGTLSFLIRTLFGFFKNLLKSYSLSVHCLNAVIYFPSCLVLKKINKV